MIITPWEYEMRVQRATEAMESEGFSNTAAALRALHHSQIIGPLAMKVDFEALTKILTERNLRNN